MSLDSSARALRLPLLWMEAYRFPARPRSLRHWRRAVVLAIVWSGLASTTSAQPNPNLSLPTDPPPEQDLAPRPQDLRPEPLLPPAVDPEALSTPDEAEPDPSQPSLETSSPSQTLCVKGFRVLNSRVFSEAELATQIESALTADATIPALGVSDNCPAGRQLTFAQILQARSAVTDLYLEKGYATSGAIIPADTPFVDGVVTVQAVEGRLEDIQVRGNRRLWSGYVRGRLGVAAKPPLNTTQLLERLQLLQLDPRIENIRADLQAGSLPGTNLLVVDVKEADSFSLNLSLDNNRSPSVGSFRRKIGLQENNLSGVGDSLSLSYSNTNGSDELFGRYTVPISPYDTTLSVGATVAENEVIEAPFSLLEIRSDSSSQDLTLEHPVLRTPKNQFDLALSLSRQFSQTELGIDNIGPFPLSAGADERGRTITSALRFAQTWTQRDAAQVIALRSQFSLGLGSFLDGTINSDLDLPDNSFWAWQGQAQWVRRLGRNSLVLLRGNLQLAGNELLSAEQLGTGGQATVRGYRQDELLTDSGFQASVEARLPILRLASLDGTLQVAPFLDVGRGWNFNGVNPDSDTLLGIGAGFIWQQPDVTARLDWGIPLLSVSEERDSWQENGVYFSVQYSFL